MKDCLSQCEDIERRLTVKMGENESFALMSASAHYDFGFKDGMARQDRELKELKDDMAKLKAELTENSWRMH